MAPPKMVFGDTSEPASSGPLDRVANGSPVPNMLPVAGMPTVDPVITTYQVPIDSGMACGSGMKFHRPAVSVPEVTVPPGMTTPPTGSVPVGGVVIPGGTVTSGTLTAGRWNFIPLPQAIPLSIGTWYVVMTGSTVGIPATGSMFGTGEPFATRSSGPLLAGSDVSPNTILGGAMNQSIAVCGQGADPPSYLSIYNHYYSVTADRYYRVDPQGT